MAWILRAFFIVQFSMQLRALRSATKPWPRVLATEPTMPHNACDHMCPLSRGRTWEFPDVWVMTPAPEQPTSLDPISLSSSPRRNSISFLTVVLCKPPYALHASCILRATAAAAHSECALVLHNLGCGILIMHSMKPQTRPMASG